MAGFLAAGEGVLSLEHLIKRRRFFDDDAFFDDGNQLREASYCFGPGEKHCMDEDAAPGAEHADPRSDEKLFHCHMAGCKKSFRTIAQYSSHYAVAHRHQCRVCGATLPNVRLLDMHVAERHDSFFAAQAARRASFACIVQGCPVLCWTSRERSEHLTSVHMFPAGYCFDLQRKGGKRRWAKRSVVRSDGREEVGDKANASSRATAMGLTTASGKVAKPKLKRAKGKKKRDKETIGALSASHTLEEGEDVVMGGTGNDGISELTGTMQRMSMVPRSISFGRRSRNRAPERPHRHADRFGGSKKSEQREVAGSAGKGMLLRAAERRPNRRQRRAAARAAAAAAAAAAVSGQGEMDMDVEHA
eukprot:g3377.t1